MTTSEYKIIIDCIVSAKIRPGTNIWLKLALPYTLELDVEKVKQVFYDDVTLSWVNDGTGKRYLQGTIKYEKISSNIVAYLTRNTSRKILLDY